ncbi:DUF4276 family protein [Candidatus Magnetaquicoccus inordinatus]|uniref:DUF4276 family protein n=1 Tax=Candidatus Magnetaquicoccus inordinatus TaxID=2496818 RepID=UPI00187D4983|nr:DUF4276 family protein [Candidatus Magnetaquicoccus inordinatus]
MIHIIVEGGGETKYLSTALRSAFNEFFARAKLNGRIQIIKGGSRLQTYKKFSNSIASNTLGETSILLVDSEDPVPPAFFDKPWEYLHHRDQWSRPAHVSDDQAHLMTQCMESWFLADKEYLAKFFGNGFKINELPATVPIEDALKQDILKGLDKAARETTKKEYSKGKHSFAILKGLDPIKVQQQSPWACRLFKTLDNFFGTDSPRPCKELRDAE